MLRGGAWWAGYVLELEGKEVKKSGSHCVLVAVFFVLFKVVSFCVSFGHVSRHDLLPFLYLFIVYGYPCNNRAYVSTYLPHPPLIYI